MKIIYVGLKDQKGDNVAGTGLVWKRGEIHDVADEKKAAKLLEYPTVWANVDGLSEEAAKKLVLEPPKLVPPQPRIQFRPDTDGPNFVEPIVMVLPPDVFKGMQNKTLMAVFMTPDDADLFGLWKSESIDNPGPKQSGPKPQAKETRPGLEKKAS